jgi:hypothetical protein
VVRQPPQSGEGLAEAGVERLAAAHEGGEVADEPVGADDGQARPQEHQDEQVAAGMF